tara:strand:+ start:6008 stop:6208 length:201 start_codon:yes stop_codon:yes gene_type:complete
MFHPALWCGAWFIVTIGCGCVAKALAARHRNQTYDRYIRHEESVDYGSSDDDSMLYLDTDADAEAI